MNDTDKGRFLPKRPSFQNSPPDCFGNSPLKGARVFSGDLCAAEAPTEPAGETWRMPLAGGVRVSGETSAKQKHRPTRQRRPPSLHPARFLKKAGQKLYVNRNLTHSKAVKRCMWLLNERKTSEKD